MSPHRVPGVASASGARSWFGRVLERARAGGLRPRETARRRREASIELCFGISRALRAGAPLERALSDATSAVTAAPPGALRAVAQIRGGRRLDAALASWAADAGPYDEPLVRALLLAEGVGGDIAACVESAGTALRESAGVDRRRDVVTAQAHASTAVLVVLPLGFAVVVSVIRGGLLYDDALRIGLAAVGLILDGLGLLWMRRITRLVP